MAITNNRHKYTAEEDAMILNATANGTPMKEIAAKIGVNIQCVYQRKYILNLKNGKTSNETNAPVERNTNVFPISELSETTGATDSDNAVTELIRFMLRDTKNVLINNNSVTLLGLLYLVQRNAVAPERANALIEARIKTMVTAEVKAEVETKKNADIGPLLNGLSDLQKNISKLITTYSSETSNLQVSQNQNPPVKTNADTATGAVETSAPKAVVKQTAKAPSADTKTKTTVKKKASSTDILPALMPKESEWEEKARKEIKVTARTRGVTFFKVINDIYDLMRNKYHVSFSDAKSYVLHVSKLPENTPISCLRTCAYSEELRNIFDKAYAEYLSTPVSTTAIS